MGEESEEVHIIALCDALGVPIRVVYLDRSIRGAEDRTANHHDFFPSPNSNLQNNKSNQMDAASVASLSTDLSKQENPIPFVTLLYRPGHYDILYPI
jgi:ubiquitin thioesterase protein OTUB1